MEGLRFLPWIWESERRNPTGSLPKCDDCMKTNKQLPRQFMGCAYEPALPEGKRVYLSMWQGGSMPNYRGPKPTVCPGYTTSLPEVIEVSRARAHWNKGGLASLGVTDWHHDPLAIGIEILEGSQNEVDRWSAENPVRK